MNEDLDRIDQILGTDQDRQTRYRAYREYYDGHHSSQLTKRMRRYLQVKYGEEFNANYCPIVVDALAERLTVTGFRAEGGQADKFSEWWRLNRMDGVQGVTHTTAVRDGDSYILVGWDEEGGYPSLSFEPAFDGEEGVHVVYGGYRRRPELALKVWTEKKARRLNLYYPDRVEHYVKASGVAGGWSPFEDEEEGRPAAEWWTTTGQEGGEPLGLAAIHFRNKDEGYNYGQSELRDVVPLQNALNKSLIDLLAAADATGFRIYTMVGDDPGNLEVMPGAWVFSKKPPNQVRIGALEGEDLSKLLSVKDSFALEIARITRTPASYFQVSSLRPAEGTLKQEEAGLVARAKARTVHLGNSWEDVMILARRVWNTYSPGPALDESVGIETIWADVETRNVLELLKGLEIKRGALGVPKVRLWSEAGYNEEQIAEMEESAEHQAALAAAQMARVGFEQMRGGNG